MSEPLVHTLRVRYAECDLHEVVFNAHYLGYFDTSMTELWRVAYGGYRVMLDRGLDMVLAEARLRFLRPARFDDELELAVAVTHLGNTSFRTRHVARLAGEPVAGEPMGREPMGREPVAREPVAEGELRHVLVERRTGVKTTIPDWMREGLVRWTVAEGEGGG
jgi:acyl-CoA thioester hydrolase